jgi:hypothetical protein
MKIGTHLVIFPRIEPEKGESFSQVIGRVLAPLATGTGNALTKNILVSRISALSATGT